MPFQIFLLSWSTYSCRLAGGLNGDEEQVPHGRPTQLVRIQSSEADMGAEATVGREGDRAYVFGI